MREDFGGYLLQRPSDGTPLHVYIDDTTLRDGEQTAGVVFANEEKLHIAKLLDEVGVYQIEAGIPVMGGDEQIAVAQIAALDLNCSILAWNRAVVSDVQASLDCGVTRWPSPCRRPISTSSTSCGRAESGCSRASSGQ